MLTRADRAGTRRQLLGFLELGLMEDTATAAKDTRRQIPMSVVDSAPHRALAKKAAVEAVILLKNKGGALPLDAGTGTGSKGSKGPIDTLSKGPAMETGVQVRSLCSKKFPPFHHIFWFVVRFHLGITYNIINVVQTNDAVPNNYLITDNIKLKFNIFYGCSPRS